MEYLQVILSFAMKTKNAWKVFPNAHSKFAPPGYSTKHSLNRLPYSDRPTMSFGEIGYPTQISKETWRPNISWVYPIIR